MRRTPVCIGSAAGLVLLVLAAAGCGSTIQPGAGASPNGFDVGSAASPVPGSSQPTSPARVGSPIGPGADESGEPEAPSRGQGRLAPGGASSVDAPGVTSAAIQIGALYQKNAGAANESIGAGGIDPGDARDYFRAAIAEVNKAGGVAGRRIVPIFYGIDSTSADTVDQMSEAACSHFNNDNKIFAMLGAGADIVKECMRRAGVLHITTESSTSTHATFSRYEKYVEASALGMDRVGRTTVEGLARTDYFAGNPVLGLMTWDHPAYVSGMRTSWLPALRARGFDTSKIPVHYVTTAESYGSVSGSAASVSSAILRFREAGVTHVMIADGPAGVFGNTGQTLMFIKAATAQRWYPRYGMNTQNSPQGGIDAGLWSAEDVPGARAVEWSDLSDAADVGTTRNPMRVHCLKVMRKHAVTIDNVNAQTAALNACDLVYFLRTIIASGGGAATVRAAMSGVARLGSSYVSPMAYATYFSAVRRDGVAAVRAMALDNACGCFKFVTKPYRLP